MQGDRPRVHCRRGFQDGDFAKTIELVEPTEPSLGFVRVDGLKYENVERKKYTHTEIRHFPTNDPGQESLA
jgi:hypothetical protein